ncbi:hypothetical protein F5Y01DRAFT_311870 [Xylaria sp. FL0043]|nr:hypothetical protein F5Y01DRAFT_311870 [Xylaria sp. FL0043]
MLEAGLSLIAACLLTTQHLFYGLLASIIPSVMSGISQSSLTAQWKVHRRLWARPRGLSKTLADTQSQRRSTAASEPYSGTGVESYGGRRNTFETDIIDATANKKMPKP